MGRKGEVGTRSSSHIQCHETGEKQSVHSTQEGETGTAQMRTGPTLGFMRATTCGPSLSLGTPSHTILDLRHLIHTWGRNSTCPPRADERQPNDFRALHKCQGRSWKIYAAITTKLQHFIIKRREEGARHDSTHLSFQKAEAERSQVPT